MQAVELAVETAPVYFLKENTCSNTKSITFPDAA
jgi:hypothetical protein